MYSRPGKTYINDIFTFLSVNKGVPQILKCKKSRIIGFTCKINKIDYVSAAARRNPSPARLGKAAADRGRHAACSPRAVATRRRRRTVRPLCSGDDGAVCNNRGISISAMWHVPGHRGQTLGAGLGWSAWGDVPPGPISDSPRLSDRPCRVQGPHEMNLKTGGVSRVDEGEGLPLRRQGQADSDG
jgi:hypothetical protein